MAPAWIPSEALMAHSPSRWRGLAAAGTVATVAAVVAALAASPASAAEGTVRITAGAKAVPDHYLVVLNDSATARADTVRTAASIAARYGGTVEVTWQHAVHGFAVTTNAAAARRLAADPRVAYVQQDTVVSVATTQPNPPSWGLDRIDQHNLPLDNSYTYATTAANVHAYIIDTGIRTTHTTFGGRASWGTNTTGDGIDTDCFGHGTHVAGTVGGAEYGVAKGVSLVAVKVLNCAGGGSTATVVTGVDWVTAHAIHPAVANMSLGGPADATLDAAVANSIASGVTYAVAAGNGDLFGNPLDACTVSPARVGTALTVGATDDNDTRGWFSNFGTCLDTFAPGVAITSSWNGSDTDINTMTGTSMAAPHVTGVAALYLATHPTDPPATVAAAVVAATTPNVVIDPHPGSPNRLLFVNGTATGSGHAGMTWALRESTVSHVGSDGVTNPYSGDTPAGASLPILCLQVTGAAVPAGMAPTFYNGWAQGSARLSPAVPGSSLTSRSAADGVCSANFGAGWRMGEFHDGHYGSSTGGWSWWAFGVIPAGQRFWVAINDQPANPWSGPNHAGMTWALREAPISHAGSDGVTNPYTGDTPASASLPVLCLQVTGAGVPAGMAPDFYNGWAQGSARLSPAVPGSSLTSRAAADGVCSANFGAGWRMGEFHDGHYGSSTGGWSWWAAGVIPAGQRFWVAINDQPANPWS
jgi:subtilisin family serine protease